MRKPKTLKEPLEVKHLGTSDVEQIQFPIREQQWEQHGYPFKWAWYAITNDFLVNGEKWIIRSICCVEVPEVRTRKYNEKNHRNLNQLVLIQGQDLFNRLIGSRYNQIELGMKDTFSRITVHREFEFQHASAEYCGGNKIDLEYHQNSQYFEVGQEFKPHFRLWRRVW
jgi:hypothetical protein